MTTAQLIAAIGRLRPLAVYGWPDGATSMDDIDWRDERPKPTQAEIDQVAALPVVPPQVTRRQARQALLLAGLLDAVQPAIDGLADPMQRRLMQIEWDDAQSFDRHRPSLLALAARIGLSDSQLDALFVQAAAL
jgi:hypothetical protein